MKKLSPKKIVLPLEPLDDIHIGIDRLRTKLSGLASLFMCASTHESGYPDLDERMVGLGEILKDCSHELESYGSQISEYALQFEKIKGKPRA